MKCAGHSDRLCEWTERISTGDRSSVSKDRDPAVYHPPDPEYHELCILQRYEKTYGRFKMVYAAPDETASLEELESFGEKWNSKYPKIYKSWSERWATLSTYFKYPNEMRKLIYTTNAIEVFNRQLRKVTRSRTVFPSDDSLLKMLYLATMNTTKKWTGRRRDWSQIRAQLEIYFEERLEKAEF